MPAPRVSILIPTYNGRADLERLLPVLAAQEVAGGLEIVALDSESRDGTLEVLKKAGVRTASIAQKDFGHGLARNRLGSMARGEWLVFLSQDALPVGRDFVETLIAPLADPDVAGVWARNLPPPSDDALTVRSLLASIESSPISRQVKLPEGQCLADLAPAERVSLTRFNNVASAMGRATLQAQPFPEVPFGEDSAWAARVLGAGRSLAYVAEAVVLHTHRYGPRSAFDRYRQDAAFLRDVHGLIVRPSLWSVLRGVAFELREDLRYLRSEGGSLGDWVRAPGLRLGQVLGQWRGSRAGGSGAADEAADGGADANADEGATQG